MSFEPKIVAFLCNWCSYRAADLAGTSRIKCAPNVRPIRVMCSGRVEPDFVLKAFTSGADGVLFWYIKFCEPDAFDRPQLINRLKAEGIPAAFIDMELTMSNVEAIKTRINAFSEILESST